MEGKRVAPRDVKIRIKGYKNPNRLYAKPRKKKLGFTNKLAVYILLFLAAGLVGGFILAWRSISYGFTGALVCWTCIFAPIGTAVSIVLPFVVQKSRAENTGANGEGIVYAQAVANNFQEDSTVVTTTTTTVVEESPAI